MLWMIVAVLLVLWLLGLIGNIGGGVIHAPACYCSNNIGVQLYWRPPGIMHVSG